MRLVKGLRRDDAERIAAVVLERGPFASVDALHRASGVRVASLRALAKADAFQSMGLERQRALWKVRELRDEELPLFEGEGVEVSRCRGVEERGRGARSEEEKTGKSGDAPLPLCPSAPSLLPTIPAPTRVVHDYAATGLSLKAHPVSFLRGKLDDARVTRSVLLRDAAATPAGTVVRVAGIVLVRQRPGTASGIVFMTLEDETGIANLIVRPHVYERYRADARHSVIIMAQGKVERQGEVVHVLVSRITSLDAEMTDLTAKSRDFH